MKSLDINVIFPEFNNKDYADFSLYSKYYELFTCLYIANYLSENEELFKDSDILDGLKEEFNKGLMLLEYRATLGTYTLKVPMDEYLMFEPYEMINKLKDFIIRSTDYEEINIKYTKKDYEHFHKEKFLEFVSHEPNFDIAELNLTRK